MGMTLWKFGWLSVDSHVKMAEQNWTKISKLIWRQSISFYLSLPNSIDKKKMIYSGKNLKKVMIAKSFVMTSSLLKDMRS